MKRNPKIKETEIRLKVPITFNLIPFPYPPCRAKINGKLFFKYRQRYRNKTKFNERRYKILSTPTPELFIKTKPMPYNSGYVFRMKKYNNT